MKNYYDIAIIGGGIGGLMTAWRLTECDPALSVCIIEKGHSIDKRTCPIVAKKVDKCIKCPSCAIMEGLAGAGAFSDGKYVISTEYGGWLTDFLKPETVIDYIEQADQILVSFGATTERFLPDNELKKLCLAHDLHMNQAQLKHLGTDSNFETMRRLIEQLRTRCDILTDTEVTDVDRQTLEITARSAKGEQQLHAGRVIFAVGRVGSRFFSGWCSRNGIPLENNQVDVGVRVELPAEVFSDLTDELYESKIVYRTSKYEDFVRTFCMNPRGAVVNENTNGIITVNGHSYEDPAKQTENTNFALLVSKHFSEPFHDSNGYGESIARLSNMLGGGVILQRFGDLIRGQRSTQKRIDESFVTPTLNATPGDLSLVLPKRILDGIIEMIYALDKIAPGTANDDTLLYGVEVKFYNMEVEVDEHLSAGREGLYVIGDGSGITHSLSHASASGVYVARNIAGC